MGRPIKKKWFGLAANAGSQIVVNGIKFADGTTATNGYIVKQFGDTAYVVQDTAKSHAAEICFLANQTAAGSLAAGQCFILATPFGGSARPVSKIQQYRLDLYESNGTIGNYSWATLPANRAGQANLITAAEAGYPVNTVAPAVTGTTTAGSTLTSSTGTWTGNATITYAYQWTLNGANVGTGASTYVIPAGAAGRLIICKVTATNAVNSATANSNTITTT